MFIISLHAKGSFGYDRTDSRASEVIVARLRATFRKVSFSETSVIYSMLANYRLFGLG
jgi:hypothetical protein